MFGERTGVRSDRLETAFVSQRWSQAVAKSLASVEVRQACFGCLALAMGRRRRARRGVIECILQLGEAQEKARLCKRMECKRKWEKLCTCESCLDVDNCRAALSLASDYSRSRLPTRTCRSSD